MGLLDLSDYILNRNVPSLFFVSWFTQFNVCFVVVYFPDSDKQNAINLFLGMFEPVDGQTNIWELTTDFYLHNRVTIHGPLPRSRRLATRAGCLNNVLNAYYIQLLHKILPKKPFFEKHLRRQRSVRGFLEFYCKIASRVYCKKSD